MAPKKKKKKAVKIKKDACDVVQGERFQMVLEDDAKVNWWEVFCYPYMLLGRLFDFLGSLCSGSNQCIIYWMMIQWLVCKCSKLTTPDPIIFPYYFYMFCSFMLLLLLFILFWSVFGRTVIVPFMKAVHKAYIDTGPSQINKSALMFRRYCFRKGEIFDTSFTATSESVVHTSTPALNVMFTFVDLFMFNFMKH